MRPSRRARSTWRNPRCDEGGGHRGYWFFGRPRVNGEKARFHPYGKTRAQVLAGLD
jgi:hypothetical protein